MAKSKKRGNMGEDNNQGKRPKTDAPPVTPTAPGSHAGSPFQNPQPIELFQFAPLDSSRDYDLMGLFGQQLTPRVQWTDLWYTINESHPDALRGNNRQKREQWYSAHMNHNPNIHHQIWEKVSDPRDFRRAPSELDKAARAACTFYSIYESAQRDQLHSRTQQAAWRVLDYLLLAHFRIPQAQVSNPTMEVTCLIPDHEDWWTACLTTVTAFPTGAHPVINDIPIRAGTAAAINAIPLSAGTYTVTVSAVDSSIKSSMDTQVVNTGRIQSAKTDEESEKLKLGERVKAIAQAEVNGPGVGDSHMSGALKCQLEESKLKKEALKQAEGQKADCKEEVKEEEMDLLSTPWSEAADFNS